MANSAKFQYNEKGRLVKLTFDKRREVSYHVERDGSRKRVVKAAFVDVPVDENYIYYGDGDEIVGLAPGTEAEILTTHGSSSAPTWEDYDLDGVSLPYFKATKNSTSQVIDTSFEDLVGWDQDHADGAFSFNGTTGVLTFSEAGLYLVIVDVTGSNGISNSQMNVKAQLDTGSGFADVADLAWHRYSSSLSGTSKGGVNAKFLREFSAGDDLKVLCGRSGPNITITQDEVRLYAVKLQGHQGLSGAIGAQGDPGAEGDQGPQGDQGEPGPAAEGEPSICQLRVSLTNSDPWGDTNCYEQLISAQYEHLISAQKLLVLVVIQSDSKYGA